jgi:iron(III) transport system permease protein
MMRGVLGWSAIALLAVFFAVFLLLPLGISVAQGLSPSVLAAALAHPLYRQGLLNAGAIALVSTLLTMLIALPLAWIGARYRFPGQRWLEPLALAPLILPPFVGAIGFAQLFGQFGAVNSLLATMGMITAGQGPDWLGDHRFAAVCVLEALHLYPILYLTTAASLARLDPSLIEAAQHLGAGPWTRFTRVVLPQIRPGVFGGGIVVLVWSFTELGTPLMLGYDRATPVQIYHGLSELGTNPLPFALVVILLVVSLALYLVARLVFLRRHDELVGRHAGAWVPRPLRGWRGVLAAMAVAAIVVCAAAPHAAVALIAVSGSWYGTVLPESLTLRHVERALAHPSVVPGVINSLIYAGGATLLALVIGTFIAWIGTRWRPRGWQLLDGLAMLPLAIPGVILAFGYLVMVMGIPQLRALFDPVRDPTAILIIAYAVRRLPHVVRAGAAGLAQVPVVYEEAAASLGAGLAQRLRRVTLPLVLGSLAAGALLTFSFSMLEVSDSLILAQRHDAFPITKVLFELVNIIGGGPAIACAFAVWAMLFLASALALASALLGRGVTTLFRE